MIITALALAAASSSNLLPDGRRLTAGDHCSVLTINGKDEGLSREVIRKGEAGGRLAWDIVIHQSLPGRHFDMRDHFVLDRRTLSPIAFDNRRDGVEHVRLAYSSKRVTGTRLETGAVVSIDLPLPRQVWDGNLWGTTIAALPLESGKTFNVPFYQYDKGIGQFVFSVTGSETVATPTGPAEAWTVDVDVGDKTRSTYLIGRTGAELGYRAGAFAQRLGGDCSALD